MAVFCGHCSLFMKLDSQSQDRYFEGFDQRFANNIYNTNKGRLRLALLEAQMREALPQTFQQQSLKVLDLGAGLGHMSGFMAKLGHEVTLVEPSKDMFNAACDNLKSQPYFDQLTLVQQSAQEFEATEPFDLIICHAVLEWTHQPQQIIQKISTLLKPSGLVSLAFYNQHSIHIANAIKGNLRKLKRGDIAGDGTGLTPINPLFPDSVQEWLTESGLAIGAKYGVRCLHDFMWRSAKEKISFEDILEMELNYCDREPYRSMGRYCHWVLAR